MHWRDCRFHDLFPSTTGFHHSKIMGKDKFIAYALVIIQRKRFAGYEICMSKTKRVIPFAI